ncbi:cyclase family protein [Aestuariicella hydrocarbonica]|uniref:Cyclase family protein n=1 Tax=Pseudomaricurvus hydrocarbonicus TaxID=1470433 RepID=A0A9E5JUI6_9GAMM|nr:cyclase family protein [Aestuariicella hydrocarbonica]NHO65848.1 cyclase family protein [Aestuariicella hydrocarbonica]
MKIKSVLWYLLGCVLVCSHVSAGPFDKGRWLDLTHDFSEETVYWPTSETFKKTTVFEGHNEAGYYYSAYNISTAEHGGTHIDAPIHFFEGRHTVDQIPIDQLIGVGVVIRVDDQARSDRNYQFSVEDIKAWERQHGRLPEHCILLIDTGSSQYWPDKKAYMGTDQRGDEGVKQLRFPGIHPKAAQFLVGERKIKAVGIDTPSLDYGGSRRYQTHQILFEHNIPGFENVANVSQLPETGFTVIALPMKIRGGSGGPLRIVAFVPKD